jgi:hypothetical protein
VRWNTRRRGLYEKKRRNHLAEGIVVGGRNPHHSVAILFFFLFFEDDNRIAEWVHSEATPRDDFGCPSVSGNHHNRIFIRNVVVGAVLPRWVASGGDENGEDVLTFGNAVFECVAEFSLIQSGGDVFVEVLVAVVGGGL